MYFAYLLPRGDSLLLPLRRSLISSPVRMNLKKKKKKTPGFCVTQDWADSKNMTYTCVCVCVHLCERNILNPLPLHVCETPDTQSVKLWLQVNFLSVLILAAVWHRAWPTFSVPVDQERKNTSRCLFITGLQRGCVSPHLTPFQISPWLQSCHRWIDWNVRQWMRSKP